MYYNSFILKMISHLYEDCVSYITRNPHVASFPVQTGLTCEKEECSKALRLTCFISWFVVVVAQNKSIEAGLGEINGGRLGQKSNSSFMRLVKVYQRFRTRYNYNDS